MRFDCASHRSWHDNGLPCRYPDGGSGSPRSDAERRIGGPDVDARRQDRNVRPFFPKNPITHRSFQYNYCQKGTTGRPRSPPASTARCASTVRSGLQAARASGRSESWGAHPPSGTPSSMRLASLSEASRSRLRNWPDVSARTAMHGRYGDPNAIELRASYSVAT